MVDTEDHFVLLVGFQAGRNSLLRERASRTRGGERALVRILNEHDARGRRASCEHAWGAGTGTRTSAVASILVEHRKNGINVQGIQRIVAVIPILTAEGADRQVQLHDVEELAIAGEDLPLAILQRIPRKADAGSNFVTPVEFDRLADPTRGLIFRRQEFVLKTDSSVDGNAVPNRPRVLHKQSVVHAGCFAVGADVVQVHVPVSTGTAAVNSPGTRGGIEGIAAGIHSGIGDGAICRPSGAALVRNVIPAPRQKIDIRFIPVLQDGVRQTHELVTELQVVRAPPSALEPGDVGIDLVAMGLVVSRVVDVIRNAEKSSDLGQRGIGCYWIAEVICRPYTVGEELIDDTAGGRAEVMIVLKVVAPAESSHQVWRDSVIQAYVGGYVWCSVAKSVTIYLRRTGRSGIGEPVDGVRGGKKLAALSLVLEEPRTEHANFVGQGRVDASIGVVGLLIAAEWSPANLGWERAVPRPIPTHNPLQIPELGVEADKEPKLVLLDRAAEGEARENVQ